VIGTTPTPASAYPAGPNWCVDLVGSEEPLGYSIEDHEPVGTAQEIEASRPSDLRLSSCCIPAQGDPNLASDSAPLAPPGVEQRGAGLGTSSIYRRA
jgi:hypothetical protein